MSLKNLAFLSIGIGLSNQLVMPHHPSCCGANAMGETTFSVALSGLDDLAQPVVLNKVVIFDFEDVEVPKIVYLTSLSLKSTVDIQVD